MVPSDPLFDDCGGSPLSRLATTPKKLRKARRLDNDELVGMGWNMLSGSAMVDPWAVAVFHELRERLKDGPYRSNASSLKS
jgi:hypothetical protein